MYPAKHYQDNPNSEAQQQQLKQLIQASPLASLIFLDTDHTVQISHIPFHFDQTQQQLIGHVSNHHPLAKKLATGHKVQLVFHGADSYISPNDSQGQAVPTWNYAKVIVDGKAKIITADAQKKQQMNESTRYFEQTQTNPWSMSQQNNTRIEQMLKAISIFTVTIDKLAGQLKLSQNKPIEVQQQICQQLSLRGEQDLANTMKLFNNIA